MVFSDTPVRIGKVPQRLSREALELVFSYCTAEEKRNQIANVGDELSSRSTSHDLLLGAWRADRLVGAVLCHKQPGKTAVLQLPRLVAGERESTARLLFDAIYAHLAKLGFRLVQVMLNPARREPGLLRLGGLRPLTEVHYVVSELTEMHDPSGSPPEGWTSADCRIEFLACGCERSRFRRVMEATFVGSFDCVGLEVAPDMLDLLLERGRSCPVESDHPFIVRCKDRDIGCVLLIDHPRHDLLELMYMGLTPDLRGKGFGAEILRRTIRFAKHAGRTRLAAAVDRANQPALQAYMAAGFRTWRRRRLYVKRIAEGDAASTAARRSTAECFDRFSTPAETIFRN